jgi:N-methylhydantoinase B/oxoprolinase/acetone carboxylase alpha subunit
MATQPKPVFPETAAAVDPVTVEVIRGAIETVAYEMASHVSLTATTPIRNQSNERNATILDGRGALAARSVGIPQFMLSSTLPVQFAPEFFAEAGRNAGDVRVANDPDHGANRTPTLIGDLRAQVGAAQLGARRPSEIVGRYGVEAVRAAYRHSIDSREGAGRLGGPGHRAELDRFGNYEITLGS